MVTLSQLEYIVAVDTYRHFVTASEKCFVTQPTLSMQIKKMEEMLGVNVFDRTKHPVIPTEVGEKIITQARIILGESNKLKELVDTYHNTISGELVVGIIPSLAPYLLPLFVGSFTRKHPEVTFRVVELLTDDIIEQLKKDTLDVGILVTPLHDPQIKERPIFKEEMFVYANKNHPLASGKEIQSKALASPDLWLLSNGHCFRSQVINLCNYKEELKDDQHFAYESGSLETLKRLVEKEGGFTMLPELAVDDVILPEVVVRTFDSPRPVRQVSFAFTRNYSKMRLMDLLETEIQVSLPPKLLDQQNCQTVEWR